MIYGHGDDTWRYGDAVKMNFSSNVYQRADLTELKDYLATRLDVIANYPEPEAKALEALIAGRLDIPENMVMVTNGANEAIYLIAQLYRGWTSVIPQPPIMNMQTPAGCSVILSRMSAPTIWKCCPRIVSTGCVTQTILRVMCW